MTAGGAAPASQNVTLSNTTPATNGGVSLSWFASESTGSLTFTPANGSVFPGKPVSVAVGFVNPTKLAVGVYRYTAVFSCSSPGVSCQGTSVGVILNVAAAKPPVSPIFLSFTSVTGALPPPKTLTISNNSATVSWTVTTTLTSAAPANWINVSPTSGTAGPGSPGTTTVSISPIIRQFPAGSYTANVTVSTSPLIFFDRPVVEAFAPKAPLASGTGSQVVPVTLTVGQNSFIVSPPSMVFAALVNAPGPASQLLNVSTTSGTLSFSAASTASWLSVSPPNASAPTNLTVAVQPDGLAAGVYTAFINFTPSGSATSQPYPVGLVVEQGADGATTFNYQIGGAQPASQMVFFPGTGVTTTFAASAGSDQGDWLSVSPPTSSVGASGANFTLTAMPGFLPAGQYHAIMALTDSLGDSYVNSATLNITGGQSTYYFSDLAFAGGFQTTLTLINDSPQAVTCTTTFYSDSGALLSVPFSQGSVSSRADVLGPGQSVHDQTVASLNATVTEGWAQSSCSGPVQASLLYRYYQNGVAASEAGVNAETAPTTSFVTFAETATGVAYANPSSTQSATVTFTVTDSAGAQLGSKNITLGPLAHGSANLGPLLNLQTFTGSLKITSTIPIISLSLNAEAFPVISSLPPGDLPSGFGGGGGTANYYFSDLAFAGGFQTTLTLINYSPQAVTCTTSFYSNSGTPLSVPFGQGTITSRTDVLPAGGSLHDQTVASLAAAVTEGWAHSICTGAIQASLLYRYYQNGAAASEAGVNAETAPTTKFVTFAQTATGAAYANPSSTQSAMVTFSVISSTGVRLGTKTITLAPLAHGSANLGPLLSLQSFTGSVEITSTIPIISLSLNAEAFPVISSLPPGDLPDSTTLF